MNPSGALAAVSLASFRRVRRTLLQPFGGSAVNAKMKGWLGTAVLVIVVLAILKAVPMLDDTRYVPVIGGPRPAA